MTDTDKLIEEALELERGYGEAFNRTGYRPTKGEVLVGGLRAALEAEVARAEELQEAFDSVDRSLSSATAAWQVELAARQKAEAEVAELVPKCEMWHRDYRNEQRDHETTRAHLRAVEGREATLRQAFAAVELLAAETKYEDHRMGDIRKLVQDALAVSRQGVTDDD